MYTIELIRANHEEAEIFMRGMVKEMNKAPKHLKLRTDQSHRVKRYLDRIDQCGKRLKTLYTEETEQKQEELEEITGQGPNVYSVFYEKLKELKDNYRKFPRLVPKHDRFLEYDPNVEFTGEEMYGRYLDLNEQFDLYVNLLKSTRKIKDPSEFQVPEYTFYLAKFCRFDDGMWRKYPRQEYTAYLASLRDYLVDFIARSEPLYDLQGKRAEIAQDFKTRYEGGEFKAWQKPDSSLAGGEDDPLFCLVCNKRFANANVFESHLDGKKHKRNLLRQQNGGALPPQDLLATENEIAELGKLLEHIVKETMDAVERRQGSTFMERQREIEIEEEEIEAELAGQMEEEDDDDDDHRIVDRKTTIDNYPVGWDGKPIPYWLYKLHGLGVEYKCQICGDMSYWGRKNFELHFQQWRHSHGMACLGIPNTKHFQDVTQIADAQALWRKLQQDDKKNGWRPDEDEEYEDDEGNVYNRKTYEDLKRQGLIK